MSCFAIMDLKPMTAGFTYSATGKTANILCCFSGSFKSGRSTQIELVLSKRACFGRNLKDYVNELEQMCAKGRLLRAHGQLRFLHYQDGKSGLEVQRYQLIADRVEESHESEPIFSNVVMEGGVRPVSGSDIFKDNGQTCKATFFIFAEPEGSYSREGYLSLLVNGYGEVAQRAERMRLRDKSHVIVSGRLEAASYGGLCVKLYDLSYCNRKNAKEGESK